MKTWEDVERLFGQVPDTEIAALVGRSKEAVRQQRAKRGIPAYRAPDTLPEQAVPLLGTMEDAEVAELFDIPKTRVTLARRKANIGLPTRSAPIREALEAIDWKNDTRTDAEIAQDLNSCTGTICRIRNDLGIPTARKRGRVNRATLPSTLIVDDRDITKYLCVLANMSNADLAELTGVESAAIGRIKQRYRIRQFRRTAVRVPWHEVVPILGTKKDSELAKELGIRAEALYAMRKKLNVPAFSEKQEALPDLVRKATGTEEEIAEQYSVTVSYVRLIQGTKPVEQED